MCTAISYTAAITGAGKGARGWFPVTQANVAFDHATHTMAEHAFLLDFTNYDIGPEARVGLEMDMNSARALLEQLGAAIEAAEATGLASSSVSIASSSSRASSAS
jgi:hypothetical protein